MHPWRCHSMAEGSPGRGRQLSSATTGEPHHSLCWWSHPLGFPFPEVKTLWPKPPSGRPAEMTASAPSRRDPFTALQFSFVRGSEHCACSSTIALPATRAKWRLPTRQRFPQVSRCIRDIHRVASPRATCHAATKASPVPPWTPSARFRVFGAPDAARHRLTDHSPVGYRPVLPAQRNSCSRTNPLPEPE